MQLLRSVVFTTSLFVGTLLYAVAVLLFSWLPSQKLYAVARSWARVNLWMLKKLCGLTYTVEGMENIPSGAHISMWKHSSAWETIAQASIFPPQAWVMKRELMWIASSRSRSIAKAALRRSLRSSSKVRSGCRKDCGS